MIVKERTYIWNNFDFGNSKQVYFILDQMYCAFDETFVVLLTSHYLPPFSCQLRHVDKNGRLIRKQQLQPHTKFTMVNDHEVLFGDEERIYLLNLKDATQDRVIGIPQRIKKLYSCCPDYSGQGKRTLFQCFYFEKTKLFCLLIQDKKLRGFCHKNQGHISIDAIYLPMSSIYSATTQNIRIHNLEFDNIFTMSIGIADHYSQIYCMDGFQATGKLQFKIVSVEGIKTYSFQVPERCGHIWIKNQEQFFAIANPFKDEQLFTVNNANRSFHKVSSLPFKYFKRADIVGNFKIFKVWNEAFIFNSEMKHLSTFQYQEKFPAKFFFQDSSTHFYEGKIMIVINETSYDNKIFDIKTIEIFAQEDVYMHMLLHLNEDFDDDILLDCINILVL